MIVISSTNQDTLILMLTKIFGFDPQTMSIKKEVVGGITTFLTMAYILALNPYTLSLTGMDKGAVFTTTILGAVVATLVMAIYAKKPFGLAPGVGVGAFFAYTVCLTLGYPWQFALTAVFLEGLIFILLTITGLRQILVESMPLVLRRAISPGIGLFIAFIGLKNASVIVNSDATFVTLGNVHDPGVLLTFFGILLTAVLLIRNVLGALLIGIVVTTIVGIPLGITNFSGIFDLPPSNASICMQFQWSDILSFDMFVCVVTLLFLDMFDTMGTLIGVCNRAGMVREDGTIPGLQKAFMADAVGTTIGAMLGTSTVTTYVESASGVQEGGRSGLTAFVTAICFLLSLFLAPFFLCIPPAATAPALFLVGVMMMNDIRKVDFADYANAIPCFVCIAFMPLTFSISEGILMSLITYVFIRLCCGRIKELNIGMVVLALLFILKYAFL